MVIMANCKHRQVMNVMHRDQLSEEKNNSCKAKNYLEKPLILHISRAKNCGK
jgi:hypothetical protein